MRFRVLSVLLLALVGFVTFSWTRGQERVPPTTIQRGTSATKTPPLVATVPSASATQLPSGVKSIPRDFSTLGILQKEMLLSCQGGADWLYRMNGIKGRFLSGYLPALKIEMEGDHYLRQVGGAFALARVARFLGEDRYAVRATQAILALLDETVLDSSDPQCRRTSLPSGIVNRLGAAGMLVLAINELPAPQPDLLDKSEQMCNWIRRQARTDGSLRCQDAGDNDKPKADEAADVNAYPGLALYAVLRSQKHRPAAWKTELARKALPCYRTWWNAHRNMAFVPWQTAAFAEAYLQTKDAACADFVYEMNDWLCGLQYDGYEPRRVVWYGGFMHWADGKPVDSPPDIGSAVYAESLAEACRMARAGSDVTHHQRYSDVMVRCLQFVVRLQYTDANAQHFADWYRPRLVGAFHASSRDGNLRLDYTQHALSALTMYLEDASQ